MLNFLTNSEQDMTRNRPKYGQALVHNSPISGQALVPSKTFITTNLNAQELEERCGNRVRSRMRQLFNLIVFDKETLDKRE